MVADLEIISRNSQQIVSKSLNFPASATVARTIAESAVALAKQYGHMRGWKGTERLQPAWGKGWVGIVTRDAPHLLYQEYGTKARIMWEVQGKTIPIRDSTGLHFVTATDVGQPGWAHMPDGRIIWREQKWRHPGIKPTNFMNLALQDSIRINKQEIKREFVSSLVNRLGRG